MDALCEACMGALQAVTKRGPDVCEPVGSVEPQTNEGAATCSCSVSRLLRDTNAEQLKTMKAEFARHGGRLDLQEVSGC